jgi:hypothetical protein
MWRWMMPASKKVSMMVTVSGIGPTLRTGIALCLSGFYQFEMIIIHPGDDFWCTLIEEFLEFLIEIYG